MTRSDNVRDADTVRGRRHRQEKSMSRYQVWSTHVPAERDSPEPPHNELEVSRTDYKVAQEDAAIFREIFHRKSWVVDTQEAQK